MSNLKKFGMSYSERMRRQKAVDYARASVALEGFKLSALDEQRARAFVNGDLSLFEFVDVDCSKCLFN